MARKVRPATAEALDARLRTMFQTLQDRPLPAPIRALAERMVEGEAPPAKARRRAQG